MRDWWLDDLHIHGIDPSDPVNDFWISPNIQGLESPDVRETVSDKPGEDGADYASSLYGKRLIPLPGVVQGDTAAAYEANRRLLSDTVSLRRDTNGLPTAIRVRFKTVGGNAYFFFAYPGKPIMPVTGPMSASFMLSLTAEDPRIYIDGAEVSTSGMQLPVPTGLTFPVTFPATFGGVAQGTYVISNAGKAATYPVLTLHGSLTNPSIYNATTGRIMQLNYTLTGSDVVKIYMGRSPYGLGSRILLNDTDNLFDRKADGSEWWALAPGDNVISVSSASTGDTGTVDILFNPAVMGV